MHYWILFLTMWMSGPCPLPIHTILRLRIKQWIASQPLSFHRRELSLAEMLFRHAKEQAVLYKTRYIQLWFILCFHLPNKNKVCFVAIYRLVFILALVNKAACCWKSCGRETTHTDTFAIPPSKARSVTGLPGSWLFILLDSKKKKTHPQTILLFVWSMCVYDAFSLWIFSKLSAGG